MTATVYLVRHGRTGFNANGLLRGHLDPDLDEFGVAEVAVLAETLAAVRPVRIVTSPLLRARHTADIIAARAQLPVEIAAGLIDRDYGPWAGDSEQGVIAEWGSLDAAPGVESAAHLARRARAVLEAQIPDLVAGPRVLVAHDAINRNLLSRLDPSLGRPDRIPQRTACCNTLRYDGGTWTVEVLDEKSD